MILQGRWYLYFSALSVNLLSVSTGNSFSWTSPAIPVLYDILPGNPLSRPITRIEESWIVSLVSLGAACGPLVAGASADRYGRKRTLLFSSILFIASFILKAFIPSIEYFYVIRFVLGLGAGFVYTVIPMYVAEISEKENRGVLSCLLAVFFNVGLLYCYSIGPFTDLTSLSLFCVIPCTLFVILFSLCPESPYYLVKNKDYPGAEEALAKLRGGTKKSVQSELVDIIKSTEANEAKKRGYLAILKSRNAIKALCISCGVMFVQQSSGMVVVLSFMQPIFDATGSSIPGDISTIIVGTIQLFMNTLASLFVDKLGRRILLLAAAVGCSLSNLSLGTFFHLKNNSYNVESLFWLPITSLLFFVMFYSCALGAIPWTIAGEIFPPDLKPQCATIATCFCLFLSWLFSMFFPILAEALGMDATFWLFSGLGVFGVTFVYFVVPETKGKSFDEIQKMLGSK